MFKRNPDVVALVLISGFLLVAGVTSAVRPARYHARLNPAHSLQKEEVKMRLHRTVASLKQCLLLRSHYRPIQRPL